MAEPRFDVTSLGEMLLRLSVPSGKRLQAAQQLDLYPAGAEANVVSLLARLERKTMWAGALPENPLGRLAANALRSLSRTRFACSIRWDVWRGMRCEPQAWIPAESSGVKADAWVHIM